MKTTARELLDDKGHAVCSIDRAASLDEAAARMLATGVSSLVVLQEGAPVAIVT